LHRPRPRREFTTAALREHPYRVDKDENSSRNLQTGPSAVAIYLPIADLPVNIFLLLALGLAVGYVSGMFGVGGGFLMTPLLIFLGVAPGVAVASVATHITASSFSGTLSYWRRRAVDIQLAIALLAGGLLGTWSGIWIFTTLRSLGQLELMISFSYLVLLSAVGGLMVAESLRSIIRLHRNKAGLLRRSGTHTWVHGLPFRFRFRRSKIFVSVIPVFGIGYLIAVIGVIMGIGGGFLLVPMLIYFLRVPTATVIGTAAVLTTATMALATVMHAVTSHLVDAILALVLMVGGVVGAQFGARSSQKLAPERLRFLLGFLILAVGFRFGYELISVPDHVYTIRVLGSDL
jgi:uncharacterized protein